MAPQPNVVVTSRHRLRARKGGGVCEFVVDVNLDDVVRHLSTEIVPHVGEKSKVD